MSSRAEKIRKRATFPVECPSGNEYLLRKGSPREVMMLTGEIPVEKSLVPEGAADEDAVKKPPELAANDSERALGIARMFAERYVVDPKIVFVEYPAGGAGNEAAYWQMSGDVTHLLQEWVKVCMGVAKPEDLRPFRDRLGSGEPGPAGAEIPSDAARDSKPQRTGTDD